MLGSWRDRTRANRRCPIHVWVKSQSRPGRGRGSFLKRPLFFISSSLAPAHRPCLRAPVGQAGAGSVTATVGPVWTAVLFLPGWLTSPSGSLNASSVQFPGEPGMATDRQGSPGTLEDQVQRGGRGRGRAVQAAWPVPSRSPRFPSPGRSLGQSAGPGATVPALPSFPSQLPAVSPPSSRLSSRSRSWNKQINPFPGACTGGRLQLESIRSQGQGSPSRECEDGKNILVAIKSAKMFCRQRKGTNDTWKRSDLGRAGPG